MLMNMNYEWVLFQFGKKKLKREFTLPMLGFQPRNENGQWD